MKKFLLPKIHFNVERWKWNAEYRVYVSNQGNIKSADGVIIKPLVSSATGYLRVKAGGRLPSVHRLVMKTWKPTEGENDLTVDHINHNKRDNSLKNLEWVTCAENRQRAQNDLIIDHDKKPSINFSNYCLILEGNNKIFLALTVEELVNKVLSFDYGLNNSEDNHCQTVQSKLDHFSSPFSVVKLWGYQLKLGDKNLIDKVGSYEGKRRQKINGAKFVAQSASFEDFIDQIYEKDHNIYKSVRKDVFTRKINQYFLHNGKEIYGYKIIKYI